MLQADEDLTRLLQAWSGGDEDALHRLIPRVHGELHSLARRYRRREHREHTLQTTALVNEAYLRLVDCDRVRWQDRAHFFAVCARVMRRILVDYARSQHRAKRGGGARPISIEGLVPLAAESSTDLVAVHDALTRLAQIDPRKADIVELRFFGGLSVEEAAEVLHVSPGTIKRDWSLARAWLRRELAQGAVREQHP
jgi:RNA polymerase sigma-70 factor (ECF subfamily)